MESLLNNIRACTICAPYLPHSPKPVLAAAPTSKILLIGQAPGSKVHQSGILWDDASGNNLREWLQMDHETFYNPNNLAVVPMGFCYPGKGKSGDLPPRPECAVTWHAQILSQFKSLKLTLLVGNYAQRYYLRKNGKETLTETVRAYHEYLPNYFPLPHPSPRNNIWMKNNSWFKEEVIPALRKRITEALKS